MRTVLVVLCTILVVSFSLEAKKKIRIPASQQTAASKQHRAAVKQIIKSRKVPKHRQSMN
jgi:hypothetical protein